VSILSSTHAAPMNVSNSATTAPIPQPEKPVQSAFVSSGWLGPQSIFERPDKRKMGRAMSTSFVVHGLLFLAIFTVLTIKPAVSLLTQDEKPRVVFLQQPGPGGGGGGSPAPAPPKPMEIPKHKMPDPVPVPTVVPPPPPPIPQLNAPVVTTSADAVQAMGLSSVSLAAYGGQGRGTGIGPGTGSGVGPGTGGGFGGGAFREGNGVINPTLIRSKEPAYTSEAMRAKIQGDVELEAVVMPNGLIGEIRVVKSLDDKFGLDQEAIKAAKQWVFSPGTRLGEKVPVLVTLILTFRLH
jgi:periplasmic protein TonB